jgi:hypothetical protein
VLLVRLTTTPMAFLAEQHYQFWEELSHTGNGSMQNCGECKLVPLGTTLGGRHPGLLLRNWRVCEWLVTATTKVFPRILVLHYGVRRPRGA